MKNRTIYLTTPIYYPNDNLHIGHTYTNIATDTISRYYKLNKYDVFFTTGNDEHGQKIEITANNNNISPQNHVDKMFKKSVDLWESLNIEYDYFARTTSDQHKSMIQKVWKKMIDNGDIYKDQYEGWYCISDETFLNDSEVIDEICQICGKKVEKLKEESYFFKMSKYTEWIKEYYKENPNFLQPTRVQNEMLSNFINDGLKDLSISRTTFKWGINVPGDENHVMYVWIDALFNYLSSLDYLGENDMTNKYWDNNAYHIVGKEITRFHAIYWPIFLHSLGLDLPKKIFAHGWLLMKDGKMSKSKGNVIRPKFIIDRYGSDALRYYLMREIPFGSDGKFTPESFINRYNSDLVNDFSNLIYRTQSMALKYLQGNVETIAEYKFTDSEYLLKNTYSIINKISEKYEKFELSLMIENIWEIISSTNKYIDLTKPWMVAKEDKDGINEILYVLFEQIRKLSVLIYPIIPETSIKLRSDLNIIDKPLWEQLFEENNKSWNIKKSSPLFQRLDINEELEYFEYELKKKTLKK